MDGVTDIEKLLVTVVLLVAAFVAVWLVAAVIEAAYEREQRRRRPRPRIPDRERNLLGEDWREVSGRRVR